MNGEEVQTLVANGIIAVSEVANMPSTLEAIEVFQKANVLYAPSCKCGWDGVSVSGLGMTQNSEGKSWSTEEVDNKLKWIMANIH